MALRLTTTRSQPAAPSAPVTADSSLADLVDSLSDQSNSFAEFRVFRDAADKRLDAMTEKLPAAMAEAITRYQSAMDVAAEAQQTLALAARKAKLDAAVADELAAAAEYQLGYVWAAFVTSVDEYLAREGGAARRSGIA